MVVGCGQVEGWMGTGMVDWSRHKTTTENYNF